MTVPCGDEVPEGFVDRRGFLSRVGIDRRTLTRWIAEGHIEPKPFRRGSQPIHMFSEADVVRGRRIIALLRQYRGRFRLADVVAVVDNEKDLPEHEHNPADRIPPRTT